MNLHNLSEAAAVSRHEAPPWSERRDLARQVVESLASGPVVGNGQASLLCELAGDAKWEVRREVAEGLLYLGDSDFFHLAGLLASDSNSFVRRAAERAMDRRRQVAKQAGFMRRTVDEIKRQVDLVERNSGPAAAARVWRICDRYGELVVGSMVHDLRSILTYLSGHCQALIDEGHKRRKAALRVRADLDFLQRTINDMEAFTQPIPSERHQERLAELARVAADLAVQHATQCGSDLTHIELRLDVADAITVDVARHSLVMALANVIKNALEACAATAAKRAGEVQVDASRGDGGVQIRIRDNGIGMLEEEACSLLLPGRRNKSKRYSTGYGLPIAMRNVAAHGGTLTLESQKDVGTTVTINMPVHREETDHDHEGPGGGG